MTHDELRPISERDEVASTDDTTGTGPLGDGSDDEEKVVGGGAGAVGGAAIGTAVGGPVGTVAGAVIGGVAGAAAGDQAEDTADGETQGSGDWNDPRAG